MTNTFKEDVRKGLEQPLKTLPSKYFYDKKGDALFVEIMNLPEYYLTRCELEIFQNKTNALIEALQLKTNTHFELIELGAGDGLKTKHLLKALKDQHFNFEYIPVDISANALQLLQKDLNKTLPDVAVRPKQGDYFEVLASLKHNNNPKVILFLGSNIGNMEDVVAQQFIYNLGANLQKNDMLLLGVDLIKPEDIVLPAYNDSKGITAQFNLNILERINNELEANFNLDYFEHFPTYDADKGIADSYILSTKAQTATIKAMNATFDFDEGEKIHTEISRKYNDKLIHSVIANTDFKIEDKILDSKSYFADYILKRH
ncbi:L-histidine N(alpha)-methyltransferase [Mesoflavibacter zeaxanthinifaciens]|uniref:L-histidine N(alpha)-methyltransferase n=1 Tax=Mesoflavibacter zeaxanthinifaciens TaxID=393060 RepID=UPI0026F210B5|nr:L-histidine N(alpha)-methyltransferase [Mesoflavibacter zeaxanthinifaciens]